MADPIPHPGYRRLTLDRASDGQIRIVLQGNFDGVPKHATEPHVNRFPKRKTIVELRKRIPNASCEVEGPLASHDQTIGLNSVDVWELMQSEDRQSFSGKIALGSLISGSPKSHYLAVKELEVFERPRPTKIAPAVKQSRSEQRRPSSGSSFTVLSISKTYFKQSRRWKCRSNCQTLRPMQAPCRD